MFEAVLGAISEGTLDAQVVAVVCNRESGEDAVTDAFFDRVRDASIPLVTVSSVGFRRRAGGERSAHGAPLPAWRAEFDRAVDAALAPYEFDLGVLAGYMLVFGHEFVQRHPLLNLHPALPGGPAGTWREVIRRLIRERATESGVMLHLAIAAVDQGPVVAYCRYALRTPALDDLRAALPAEPATMSDDALDATPLFGAIRALGVLRESPLLVATLREFGAGRLRTSGARVLDADGAPALPADLTTEVDALLD